MGLVLRVVVFLVTIGNQFVNFTVNNGLVANTVWTIYQDRDGFLWFGTLGGGGVSRYDGDKFVNFTTNEGLTQNDCDLDLRGPGGFPLVWNRQWRCLSI